MKRALDKSFWVSWVESYKCAIMFCKLQVAPFIRRYILPCYIQSESMLSLLARICYLLYQRSWPCTSVLEGRTNNAKQNDQILIADLISYTLKKLNSRKKQGWLYSQEYIIIIFTIVIFEKVWHVKNLRPAILPRKVKTYTSHGLLCPVSLQSH